MKQRIIGITAGLLLGLSIAGAAAQGQENAETAPSAGRERGPAVNATTFHTDDIKAVTSVTKVFGRSQRTIAAIVEYAAPVRNSLLNAEMFGVEGRTIIRVYANTRPELSDHGRNGAFVVIELDPADEGGVTFAPHVDEPATSIVSQVQPVPAGDGRTFAPTAMPVINTRQTNLVVDEFRQFRFADPVSGLLLNYNLYIPSNYDPAQKYPLVLFMHDYGVTGTNPLRTLVQGLGAVSFASPDDQARHPAFVLAPQYPVGLANDESQISEYPDITVRLIEELAGTYSIDRDRLYATGQSGGCMAAIALNVKYPDLFAASLLVAGQWDPAQVAPMARNRLFVIVSQDDAKAYPGMMKIMSVLERNGAKVTRAIWDGRSTPVQFADEAAELLATDPDSNIFFVAFEQGTVIPPGATTASPGIGHTGTWPIAYDIPAVRDWLLNQ